MNARLKLRFHRQQFDGSRAGLRWGDSTKTVQPLEIVVVEKGLIEAAPD
jgi:hypothetical protein